MFGIVLNCQSLEIINFGGINMKLLIIDDKCKMIELIQEQFCSLNKGFKRENTFLFQNDDTNQPKIKKYHETKELKDCSFAGCTKQEILNEIDSLINIPEHETELFFIVIDMCLKKDIVGNYDIADYYEYEEICADIYRHLIEIKNSTHKDRKLLFAIYSRSETLVSVISKVLQDQYKECKESNKDENKDEENFPYASCEAQNISWFTNLWRPDDVNCKEKISNNYPLNLPKDICQYINNLLD